MISIYDYLVEFFLDVQTFKAVLTRLLKIVLIAIIMVGLCLVFQVSAQYAFAIYMLCLMSAGLIGARYAHQRFGSKHK